ncbi:DUF2793 domain-containing protein [Pacificimonas sp. WHA3]|uniref:DUF2793 domain-containing protein n=1 Tax=Pacificimonas pallii TaxID=2827236 RepID=A0ABS6SBE5_9SPHN|nr:DUF2793 domain-containing protein [Pacificimonas pallii]MBV7255197.1 DUF2793 domain-containing protein [Pacificimonas pallii]
MTDQTDSFSIPLLQAGQAQKDVTHNEAVLRLERWLAPRVKSRSLAVPPAAPDIGDAWVVAAGGAAQWAGHDGRIAEWRGRWMYLSPPDGLLIWIEDEDALLMRKNGVWRDDGLPVDAISLRGTKLFAADPQPVVDPAGGGVIDVEARAAIAALLASLRGMGLASG